MGPRQKAAEESIEKDIVDWTGPQEPGDVERYRAAMRETTWYKAAQLSDALRALGVAILVALRIMRPAPPAHLGGGANAEDCPACVNPPYPFICRGGDL